jgi:hypothetical protein
VLLYFLHILKFIQISKIIKGNGKYENPSHGTGPAFGPRPGTVDPAQQPRRLGRPTPAALRHAPMSWSPRRACTRRCTRRWLGGDRPTTRSSRWARRGPQEGVGHGQVAGCSLRQRRGGEAEKRSDATEFPRRRRAPMVDDSVEVLL